MQIERCGKCNTKFKTKENIYCHTGKGLYFGHDKKGSAHGCNKCITKLKEESVEGVI